MFTCEKSLQRLLEFLDGDMTPEEEQALQSHLASCEPCVDFVKSYRATPELCRHHLAKQMPQQMADHLKVFLRAKLQGK